MCVCVCVCEFHLLFNYIVLYSSHTFFLSDDSQTVGKTFEINKPDVFQVCIPRLDLPIDTNLSRSHSTRAAPCFVANRVVISIDDIMKNAGWASCSTFEQFYYKLIMTDSI